MIPRRISQPPQNRPAILEAHLVILMTPLFCAKVVTGSVIAQAANKQLKPSANKAPLILLLCLGPAVSMRDTSAVAVTSPMTSTPRTIIPTKYGSTSGPYILQKIASLWAYDNSFHELEGRWWIKNTAGLGESNTVGQLKWSNDNKLGGSYILQICRGELSPGEQFPSSMEHHIRCENWQQDSIKYITCDNVDLGSCDVSEFNRIERFPASSPLHICSCFDWLYGEVLHVLW